MSYNRGGGARRVAVSYYRGRRLGVQFAEDARLSARMTLRKYIGISGQSLSKSQHRLHS